MDRQCIVAFVAALVAMATMPVVVAGQAPDGWTVPRTSDGRPDLQGTWSSDSATPLQRPEALAARVTLSDDEVAALQAHATESLNGGGDAVFGDTVFLRALASLEEPAEDQAGSGQGAVLELRPAVDVRPLVRQPHVADCRSSEWPLAVANARGGGASETSEGCAGRGDANNTPDGRRRAGSTGPRSPLSWWRGVIG